jgi:F-type H+-transporting ATPase subunit a
MFLHWVQEGEAARDTLAASGGGGSFAELFKHAYDSHELEIPFLGEIRLPHFEPVHLGALTIDLSITKHVVFLWLSAAVVVLLTVIAARRNARSNVPKGFGNLIEVFVVFVRDEIALPNMGKRGEQYLPYLLTTFFFILGMNLFGMIPYASTATGNVNVTAGLAIIAFFMIQAAAIREQGFGRYLAHLTGGVHWSLWIVMIPIEIIGLFTKPFALCIRLFANMTSGHLVIISLLGFIFFFKSYFIVPVPVAFALAIDLLELFVAFLQAYVFTILTALFMGFGMQAAHEHHEH